MERDTLRRLLDAAGYVVVERVHGGVSEVFAVNGAEHFRGFGLSIENAYANLGDVMFPSRLARRAASVWLDVLLETLGPIRERAPSDAKTRSP